MSDYDSTFGDIQALVQKIVAADQQKSGGTFHAGTHVEPTEGFAVAIPEAELIMTGEPCLAVIEKWLDQVARKHLGTHINHVGCWRDEDDDRLYLDVVCVLPNARSAEILAKSTGQIAYYDLSMAEERRVA